MKKSKIIISTALRFAAFAVLISALAVAASVAANGKDPLLSAFAGTDGGAGFTVVIDAGHGGVDGGAYGTVGEETVLEKDINLEIAKRLYFLFRAAGIPCVMTRTEDIMLGEGKAYDLKNRLEITKSYENPVFISIHQNKFPEEHCRGLQVYYSKNAEESETLALFIQNVCRRYTDPENEREIKRADSSIYLLDRLTCPAALVECGFLSNAGECEKLTLPEYQKQLASAVFAAAAEFCGQSVGERDTQK